MKNVGGTSVTRTKYDFPTWKRGSETKAAISWCCADILSSNLQNMCNSSTGTEFHDTRCLRKACDSVTMETSPNNNHYSPSLFQKISPKLNTTHEICQLKQIHQLILNKKLKLI